MKQILLATILAVSIVLRIYHIPQFMGFWYDQGRDAIIVTKLISEKKWFLIGPTTGIEGVFLGPFYYYLIAPFYWLGNGNPEIPAHALAFLNVLAIVFIFRIGKEYANFKTGLIAALIYGLSFKISFDSRWVSNPTPLPFFALICIWCLLKIIYSRTKTAHWIVLGLCLGICLQLEAASAIFFIPVALIVIIKRLTKKLVYALIAFGVTLVPQILFNIRHDNILVDAFYKFLIEQKSFHGLSAANFLSRIPWYYDTFSHRIFSPGYMKTAVMVATFVGAIVMRNKIKSPALLLLMSWWVTPLVFLLFYRGNNGFVWDYYFIGVYPAFVLCIAWVWSHCSRWITASFILIFLFQNIALHAQLFKVGRPTYITLADVTSAVDRIYEDTGNVPFNVDIYVPPVWSEAYEYVLSWRGRTKYKLLPSQTKEKRLYIIVEPDAEHPYYRQKWLNRQASYGKIEKEIILDPLLIRRVSRYDSK